MYKYNDILPAGMGFSTVLADLDFETYSEAGFIWDETAQTFKAPDKSLTKGLPCVGAVVYSEDPTCEVLSCAYDLKDGLGARLWIPSDEPPKDLFLHIFKGGLIEAWNVAFERWIWINVCVKKYGWPMVPMTQWRDAMAKALAHGLPRSLDASGRIFDIKHKKLSDGKRLIEKFSIPRKPTKTNPARRIRPSDDFEDAARLYNYNIQDILAESELSQALPDLNAFELKFWQVDQVINQRGVAIDTHSVNSAIAIIEQVYLKYNAEICRLTMGCVTKVSEVQRIVRWLNALGIKTASLDSEHIDALLTQNLPLPVRKVLLIRQAVGSAAVKKLYAMRNRIAKNGRLHDLFVYHGARTGRAAGAGVQPQNLPKPDGKLKHCNCTRYYSHAFDSCPWCASKNAAVVDWSPAVIEEALDVVATKSLECVEYYFNDAIPTVANCLRSLFIAKPGHNLICSDYSSIEAVVLAMLAREPWRIEVFRTHRLMYELSASKISGVPFEDFIKHKRDTGQHHPLRQKLGKTAELSSGYAGWIGAWHNFGASEFFNDDEIREAILAWRAASPKIVEFWGGQSKNWRPQLFGLEGAAIHAVMKPNFEFRHNEIMFICRDNVLYCRLPSGRFLSYHRPKLSQSSRRAGELSLSFEGWNSDAGRGGVGWIRIETYGGKLCENVVQAVARDILANAIINLEERGYPVVLHIHDEIIAEVKEGYGSIAEFEQIMAEMPSWAKDWPIRASGGWIAKRYCKL